MARQKILNGVVMDLTAEENAEIDAQIAAADFEFHHVRMDRDAYLRATDVTQLADYPVGDHTAEEWATYRQLLRGIPQTYSRVSEIVWPKSPPIAVIGQAAYDTEVAKDGSGPAAGETARTAAEKSAGYPGPGV